MPTSFRLSDDLKWMIAQLERRMGLKASGVVEQAVRLLAEAKGVPLPTPEQLDEWLRKQAEDAAKKEAAKGGRAK